MSNFLINQLRESRSRNKQRMEAIVAMAESENRDLLVNESAEFNTLRDEVKGADERIADLEAQEKRANEAAGVASRLTGGSRVRVNSEPSVYRKDGEASYFLDIAKRQFSGDAQAADRLSRYAMEVRDVSRTDGGVGEFVPPAWLVSDYIGLARASRVTANLLSLKPLPPGTDSINIPSITTGGAVAIQTADNAAVQETDMVTSSVAAPVRTIAGQEDVALQVIDQSPVAFDQVVFADLMADYAAKLDLQVVNGSGSSGQLQGLLGTSGIVAVTYTDGTPTVGELYAKLADTVSQISSQRYLPPTAIVMHPRRWAWFLAALDSSSRPLVVPNGSGPQNAVAVSGGLDSSASVGTLLGLPVFIDANIPTNLGAGTNEDRIIVARFDDTWLFESSLRTRVLPEVGSGTLTVRFQVYGYSALACRYAKSVAVVSGTGLVTPTF